MTPREEILQQALALGPEDRAFVAEGIEQSLEPHDVASRELAALWATELERRIAAFDRGEVQASDMNEAMDRIRGQLEKFRASR